ncbi:hypothetical protein [Polaromonas sp.]|uniref:hypothetical protein n=1 Tax=Polaromonas sp. TaxID=1869339 RepID=UPI00286D0A6E|nr:hypothetical protein [Polaromonas sp.]
MTTQKTGPVPQNTAGKGMPARAPRQQGPRTAASTTPKDASVEASLELPHERDQATDMTASQPNPRVEQAARDVGRGLKDTSKGAEMDRAYQKLKP